AVEQRLPGGRHELVELLKRALAEDRRRVADEVLPELARLLLLLRRRAEPHQPLLEPLFGERAGERLLDHEHDPVSALAQDLANPDAVVGRPERALGKEDDRPLRHAPQPIPASTAGDRATSAPRGARTGPARERGRPSRIAAAVSRAGR